MKPIRGTNLAHYYKDELETLKELKKKPWYQNALPSDQDDMQSFVTQLESIAREVERERLLEIAPKSGPTYNGYLSLKLKDYERLMDALTDNNKVDGV